MLYLVEVVARRWIRVNLKTFGFRAAKLIYWGLLRSRLVDCSTCCRSSTTSDSYPTSFSLSMGKSQKCGNQCCFKRKTMKLRYTQDPSSLVFDDSIWRIYKNDVIKKIFQNFIYIFKIDMKLSLVIHLWKPSYLILFVNVFDITWLLILKCFGEPHKWMCAW